MMDRTGIFAGDDPFALARDWLAEAEASEPNDPNAIALATVDAGGPAQRAHGAAEGDRGGCLRLLHQLRLDQGRKRSTASGKAAFVLHWKSPAPPDPGARGDRQREDGPQADAYYASRSLKSRLGAWASQQSQPLSSREALMAEVAKVGADQGTESAPPAVLGRLPDPPGRDRVLGRWCLPVARPLSLVARTALRKAWAIAASESLDFRHSSLTRSVTRCGLSLESARAIGRICRARGSFWGEGSANDGRR